MDKSCIFFFPVLAMDFSFLILSRRKFYINVMQHIVTFIPNNFFLFLRKYCLVHFSFHFSSLIC